VEKHNLPAESLWSRRSGLISCVVAVIVAVLGFILDHVLVKVGLPRFDMLIISNGLTGMFAGGLLYQLAREEKASRELVRARMKTIAELNHHIRNALQVIRFLGGQRNQGLDAMQLQLINDSVDRIEWALREVLPKYELNAPAIAARELRVKSAGPAA
jgi:hypothetical protein